MSLLIESEVRARANKGTTLYNTTANTLSEMLRKQASSDHHDIFLSHAYDDRQLILGVALMLEDLGYTVYLDWRDDPSLDRKNVSKETARRLRERMKTSKCLLFSTTQHSTESKWMPWELGFKDGEAGKAAILPVSTFETESYSGQQYLGLYPYVSRATVQNGPVKLWVNWSPKVYCLFDSWLAGADPVEH